MAPIPPSTAAFMYYNKEKLMNICRDLLNPALTQVGIAKKYGVSRQYVYWVKKQFMKRTGMKFPERHPGPLGLYEQVFLDMIDNGTIK